LNLTIILTVASDLKIGVDLILFMLCLGLCLLGLSTFGAVPSFDRDL
jgi:hypothetical protein